MGNNEAAMLGHSSSGAAAYKKNQKKKMKKKNNKQKNIQNTNKNQLQKKMMPAIALGSARKRPGPRHGLHGFGVIARAAVVALSHMHVSWPNLCLKDCICTCDVSDPYCIFVLKRFRILKICFRDCAIIVEHESAVKT